MPGAKVPPTTLPPPGYPIAEVRSAVSDWFRIHGRDFPWRRSTDPFHILVAEVLLRQTQPSRVVEPYLELIRRFPDAMTLARADLRSLRHWFQPLGLVRRADRLVRAAQLIVDRHNGRVPEDLAELMALPGVGRYSARAIQCVAFGTQVPMIDEGSGRVLRRVLGMVSTRPAYSDSRLLEAAAPLIPDASPKEFNLGLIDIAAAYCHPKRPTCEQCPLVETCAYAVGRLAHGSELNDGKPSVASGISP